MKLSDLKRGDVLTATADWGDDCWKKGDELIVLDDNDEFYVRCQHNGGTDHYLIEENLETLERK